MNRHFRRTLCRFSGKSEGPVLVCIGGLHGNEPAGVTALLRVAEALQRESVEFNGTFYGIAGNLAALTSGQRYLSEDLNRIWAPDQVETLRACQGSRKFRGDRAEQVELLRLIDDIFLTARGRKQVFFLDLHTTSAQGGPFTVFGDTLANRKFAESFPVPMILGLEEQIEGALLDYVGTQGAITLGFEAGPHDSPESVEGHEAAIWIALAMAGIVADRDCRFLRKQQERLASRCLGMPPVMEVRYRHPVALGDRFSMSPGFMNLERIRKSQKLAQDRDGDIFARCSGRILLPLYQSQGTDGFFVVTKVWPFWLKLSKFLRRLGLKSYLRLLPGVRPHPTRKDVLVVNASVARWRTIEVFHLFGYRKCRPEGRRLLFSRRSEPGRLMAIRQKPGS